MIKTIDFHWDVGSTNSYFALRLLKPIAARHGAKIVMHPFNLGHVFRKHKYVLQDEPRAKIRHRALDLRRWAARYDLPFQVPAVFPIKTSRALRGALAMRRLGCEEAYVEAIFAAYWERNDASIAEYEGLAPLVEAIGVSRSDFEALRESEDIRAELARETDSALARGVFGAPTMFVGEEMFWGKDRMEFLEAALAER